MTLEKISNKPDLNQFTQLIFKACEKEIIKIRLIGMGVHFVYEEKHLVTQQTFFDF